MLNKLSCARKGRLLAAGSVLALVVGPSLAGAQTQTQPQTQTRPQSAPSAARQDERPKPQVEMVVDGDPVMKLLPRDAIESVDDPVMVPAAAADSFMRDEEMILGVYDGKQARAYSTWHLDRHEIVNDRLGETPIAATW
jgi:hypothetical protein